MKVMSTNGNAPTRLLMYSHDGFGLGHLRRTRNVARWVVREQPDSNVLMVVGCPLGSAFPLAPGVDYVKLPSIIKVATEAWELRSLHLDREQGKALRASIIQKAAEVLDPHALLVDHIPGGVWGELLPTLKILRRRGTAIVLGLRDILDAPGVTRAAWKEKDFYQVIENCYDGVFIYGCRHVFDTASHYGLEGQIPERKIHYCGYVCSDEPYAPPEQVRRELGIHEGPLVLVTAGGGHDAYPMMRTCLEAFQLVGKPLPFQPVIVAGPLMPEEQREKLRRQAAVADIPVLSSVEDSRGCINASELVITMAGYNSLCEILTFKKKALVLPRSGPSAEQGLRAHIFKERGLIDALFPNELTPAHLAERVMTDLGRSDLPRVDPAIDLCGARRAAQCLTELAKARTGPVWVPSETPGERVAQLGVAQAEEKVLGALP